MSSLNRAATIAAILLGLAGQTISAPGFAFELDRTLNAPVSLSVPQAVSTPDSLPTPTPAVAIVPAAKFDGDAAPAPVPTPIPAIAFASLSDAVAAQDTDALDGDDAADNTLTCMAGAVYYEAKGEPLAGQLAVAEVLINRTKSGRFPKTICSVVTQPGQFSFVHGGRIPAIANSAAYRTAVAVARVALADKWDSPASDAMYFHARRVAPGWRMQKVAAIGNHVFYR